MVKLNSKEDTYTFSSGSVAILKEDGKMEDLELMELCSLAYCTNTYKVIGGSAYIPVQKLGKVFDVSK